MMDYSQAGAAANDVVAVFFLLAAVALFMTAPEQRAAARPGGGRRRARRRREAHRARARSLALTVGVIAIAPRGRRRATAGLWLGPLILAGGFWYVRNLIAVGNPLPVVEPPASCPTPAPPLQQHTGYSVAHYLTSTHLWSRFVEPALASGLGRWWWAVLAVAVAGPLLCLLPTGLGKKRRQSTCLPSTRRCSAPWRCSPSRRTSSPPRPPPGPAGDPLGFAFNLRYLAPALTLSLAVAPLAPAARPARAAAPRPRSGSPSLLAGTVAQPQLWPAAHTRGRDRSSGRSRTRPRSRSAALTRTRLAIVAAAILAAGRSPATPSSATTCAGATSTTRRLIPGPGVGRFRTIHDARVGVVGTFGGFFSYPLSASTTRTASSTSPSADRTARSRRSPPALDGVPR